MADAADTVARQQGLTIRPLGPGETDRLWSIDRSERVEAVYRIEGGALALHLAPQDVKTWPPGEPEQYGPLLRDCLEQGGTGLAALDGDTLAGAMVLESRFIGADRSTLQLKFLHVGRPYRGRGLGRALFERAVEAARAQGARWLYVSATPTENTVRFYLRRGCRLVDEADPALYALEPEDIHLELDLIRPGP